MNFTLVTGTATQVPCQFLVLPLFDSDLGEELAPALAAADRALKGLLRQAMADEGFKGKPEQTLLMHTHGKLFARRVLLLGLGSRERFTPEIFRLAVGRATKAANRVRIQEMALAIPVAREVDQCVRAAVEGAVLADYRFDRYHSKKDEDAAARLQTVRLVLPDGHERDKRLLAVMKLGQQVAEATNWARDLVNEPAGEMTPPRLAQEAQKAARAHGLKVTVRERREIERLKLGMFLGVAQGSVQPPKLVQVTYTPKNARHAKRPSVVLVGKAITFDSGGLSLKTAEGMIDMKTDMAGAAAVLGAMQVVAELAPPFPVHALLGACENMPSGTAYRPGDVLTSRSGKTVEITNTDAEGRLVLGDMLTLATELKPAAIVDVATLTGACIVALGNYVAGAFGDDDQLMYSVLESARAAGEEMWRLPITDMQKDALRSDIADMKNSGERWGASINAAWFLREFVGDTPWVHLDIAGPSQSPRERGYFSKGATGFGVRTLVELVRRQAQLAE